MEGGLGHRRVGDSEEWRCSSVSGKGEIRHCREIQGTEGTWAPISDFLHIYPWDSHRDLIPKENMYIHEIPTEVSLRSTCQWDQQRSSWDVIHVCPRDSEICSLRTYVSMWSLQRSPWGAHICPRDFHRYLPQGHIHNRVTLTDIWPLRNMGLSMWSSQTSLRRGSWSQPSGWGSWGSTCLNTRRCQKRALFPSETCVGLWFS